MKLENNFLSVHFTCAGGEMTSLKDKQTDIEYLWQGDPAFWSGRNPTLFPLVGNTFDQTYTIDNQTYAMKNHGLIRYANLECIKHETNRITFAYRADATTLLQYPFLFYYEITYTLLDRKIEIVYRIVNEDTKVMPFTFGLHPAFRVPLCKNETFESYQLQFECEEHLQQLVYDKNKEKKSVYQDVVLSKWDINYTDLEKYGTLIYKGMSSSYVTLQGPKHGVRVSIAGYPYLALWSAKRGAEFLCIEPWYGHADFERKDVAFQDREGMLQLEPSRSFTTSYSIEIL